jgi:hypothetical protein
MARSVNTAVSRVIDLDPRDWFLATWRDLRPLTRRQPAPFDRKTCLTRLGRAVAAAEHPGRCRWDLVDPGPALSQEEAHFWFAALTAAGRGVPPRELAARMKDEPCSGQLTTEEIKAAMQEARKPIPGEVLAPLATFLPPPELLELLLSLPSAGGWSSAGSFTGELRDGFARYVVPYLTAAERGQLRQRLAPEIDPQQWCDHPDTTPPAAFRLAALLGMHEPLHAVVMSWLQQKRHRGAVQRDVVFGLGDPELVKKAVVALELPLDTAPAVRAWLAHTELTALEQITEAVLGAGPETAERLTEVFCHVKAPEAAPHMLRLKLEGLAPAPARRWLLAQVGNAVAGLIPLAAGAGKLAEAAREYLRGVHGAGHAAVVEEQLGQAPTAVAEKVRRGLIHQLDDVYTPFDEATTPAWLRAHLASLPPLSRDHLPEWLQLATLPPLVVGEHCLNERQVLAVFAALRDSTLGGPRPLVRDLKQHADPAALDAFAWELFELWRKGSGSAMHRWGMTTLSLIGGDASVLKLTPLILDWANQGALPWAMIGLDCLYELGSDTALMQLAGIAGRRGLKKLQPRAKDLLLITCTKRGLNTEQLEDRIVPHLGLDRHGSRTFDFGPRQFRVVLGPDLKPMVRDEAGQVRADLPKPGSKDDPARAAAATQEWKLLKKQLTDTAKLQARRLERALIDGRRWTVPDFETALVRHPFLTNLARGLLWGSFDSGRRLRLAFRLTAEGDHADLRDEVCEPLPDCAVGLVHPALLSADERVAWQALFAEYEVFQPFPQLARPVHALEPGEESERALTRFEGAGVSGPAVAGILENLGWASKRSLPLSYVRHYAGADVTAVLVQSGWEDAQLGDVFFLPGVLAGQAEAARGQAIPLGAVDAAVRSEVLGVVQLLVSR